MIKDEISLLAGSSNVLNIPQSSIDAHKIDEEDKVQIIDTTKLFLRKVGSHWSKKIIKKQIDNEFKNYDFTSLSRYPLPGVFNKREKRIIVNTNVFGRRSILNVDPRDIYAIILYSYLSAYFTLKPVPTQLSDTIADYMSSVYIKMFAKRYGLIGSYVSEIPKLRFLVSLYVYVSFFGLRQRSAYLKAGAISKTKRTEFELDLDKYDFTDVRQFIKCLSESGVLHGISVHEFASSVIKFFNGPIALAMFEDVMRFMATIGASTISATTIFPQGMERYHPKLFKKIETVFERL